MPVMTKTGPELDAARSLVVERNLVPAAITELTEALREIPLDSLAPAKQLLKRFFSDQPWTTTEDEALADAVGAGTGDGRHELDSDLSLVWGWHDGRFRVRIEHNAGAGGDLDDTFDKSVIPEATPSPRTIRFTTPPLHDGPSRSFESADAAVTDRRVARLFGDFDDVTNVLVGPAFVAVTISQPSRWEALLAPMLRVVSDEFTGAVESTEVAPPSPVSRSLEVGAPPDEERAQAPRRLERAWVELGALRADRPEDLDRVVAASRDEEPARRQVAAALIADAPPDAAARVWDRLLDDPSRLVRRSVVDAVAGAEREELRPLLERALDDADAWTRWKALHGIAVLGAGPSRDHVAALADDPDFRVRLEASRML